MKDQSGDNSKLHSMIALNKEYLDQIKRRNMEFKKGLENMYQADPQRDAPKPNELQDRLAECELQLEQTQQEQLKLCEKLDEQEQ